MFEYQSMKHLYRSFFYSSFELVVRTTLEGKVLYANKLFLKTLSITNYPKLKNTLFQDVFLVKEQFGIFAQHISKDRQIFSQSIQLLRPDGNLIDGLLNAHLHTSDSGEEVYNWFILDITLQKKTEHVLKQRNDELAKINQQMEKFLYSTSHDLRSPITTILGLTNLMRLETKDAILLDYVSKIETSTNKLDKVIRDINSFAKASYQRIASEKIEFEPTIWRIVNSYHSNPLARKINVEVIVSGGYPFYCDPQLLEIVLENIIRNSFYFLDSNKAHCFIKVIAHCTMSEIQVECIDNGLGIGKQHLELIFNMFYKASHLAKGAGLGLYIAKETLARINGTISVESEIGFGSVFKIIIPNDHKGKLIGHKLQLINHN